MAEAPEMLGQAPAMQDVFRAIGRLSQSRNPGLRPRLQQRVQRCLGLFVTTLEDWVEKGTAPPPQTVADTAGVPGRTRPLCDYPGYPKYRGAGDLNAAASYGCAAP